MNEPFKLISWYTLNTPYEQTIKDYFLSSYAHIMNHHIYAVESLKEWKRNTNLKPNIIKQALNDFESNIVIVDADSKIHEYPILFNNIPEECDMACHILDRNAFFNRDFGLNQFEVLSGTLFFRNRNICRKLIGVWQDITENSRYPDQYNLELALKEMIDIKVYDLPIAYAWIHDLPNGAEPFVKRPDIVYVEHFQASRQLRKLIKD